jgi:DNA invertase Pin-like site-specific DNA recombinase
MEKKFAILLVRVSSLEQDYEAQIYDLKLYGSTLGYTDYHIIETKETAFADLNQKIGTNEMFKFIETNPEYNTVLMTEISRLARRQSILHSLKEYCLNKQIQIFIKDLDFKLLDESGKINQQAEMMFTLFGMFAESEVKQKLERFSRKRKELMQMGVSISGKLLFGYDRFKIENGKNTLVVNDVQATIIRTIFNWYLNGLGTIKNPSIKTISLECIRLGYHHYTHSKRNVNKLLKEEAYTGFKTTNNKRKNPKFGVVMNEPEFLISNTSIKYPVIIDADIFTKTQTKLKANTTQGDKQTKHITILSKLITCPSCGRYLQGNYRLIKGIGKNSYRCTSRGDTQPCESKSKSISMNLIDSAVWSLIKSDLSALSQKINQINPDEFLIELDNHFYNFIERENEIKNEIEENIAILNSVGKLTSPNIIQLIQNTGKKIEKLEVELLKIEKEKTKIESNKLLILDRQDNVESIINDNLSTIENSKELLKKYINSFVDTINILEHSIKYTVLELVIKDFTISKDYTDYFGDRMPIQLELAYIVLDKTITRDIKGFYFKAQTANNNYKNYLGLVKNEMIPIIKNEIITKVFDISKELNFKKLNNNLDIV